MARPSISKPLKRPRKVNNPETDPATKGTTSNRLTDVFLKATSETIELLEGMESLRKPNISAVGDSDAGTGSTSDLSGHQDSHHCPNSTSSSGITPKAHLETYSAGIKSSHHVKTSRPVVKPIAVPASSIDITSDAEALLCWAPKLYFRSDPKLKEAQRFWGPEVLSTKNADASSTARTTTTGRESKPQELRKQLLSFDPEEKTAEKTERRKRLLAAENRRDRVSVPKWAKNSEKDENFEISMLKRLPEDVVDLILRHVLTHRRAIPVDPLFRRECKTSPPALDYRILFASRELYMTGIKHYYSLNTFSFSLWRFSASPRSMAPEFWPLNYGLVFASKMVRRLKISARNNAKWEHALNLLRGFEHLDEVVFDVRMDDEIDKSNDDGMLFDAWKVVPANEELGEVLKQPGISISEGGIWVGSVNHADAMDAMASIISDIKTHLATERALETMRVADSILSLP